MYNGKTVSLKQILWKIMNNPMVSDITYETAAEFAIEAINLIGATLGYEDKTTFPYLEVNDYKTILPSDLILTRGIRAFSERDQKEYEGVALTYATDIYHRGISCQKNKDENYSLGVELTYTIQSNVLTTSFEKGYVEVAYQALPTDEEGFPLIPDNQDFKLAVEYYIIFRYLEPLFMMGKITDKAFNYISQRKAWYMGAAQSDMQFSNMDHVEATMNSINRLIINSGAQRNFFKFMGKNERLKRYN